jgi:hypothetical protein
MKKFEKIIDGITDARAKVGWFEANKYPDGTPVAYVASIQEFGSPQNSIPPRSFMRKTISEKSEDWKKLLASGTRAILAGNSSTSSVIDKVAFRATGDIRKTISTLWEPKLEDSTIQSRLRQMSNKKLVGNLYKPLVFTGQMLDTLDYRMETK